jgi:FkbM family methyltransferase
MINIVDVGANSGELIDYIYDELRITDIKYLAIEPNRVAFEKSLIEKKQKNIGLDVEFAAIAEKSGKGKLFASNVMNGQLASLLPLNKKGNWDKSINLNQDELDEDQHLPIDQISVTDLISKYKIKRIDFLKIDTQGTDIMILSEFLKVIEIKVIAVEVETSSENSESHYLNSDNSLGRLVELCKVNELKIIKMFPVNSDCSEFNVFLAKNTEIYNELDRKIGFSAMPPFKRFWRVLGIGISFNEKYYDLNRSLLKKLFGAFLHPISSYKSLVIKLTR